MLKTDNNFMPTIIDISIPLENGVKSDPPGFEPKIQYTTHKDKASLDVFAKFFPGLTPDQLPDGEASAYEHISLSTHTGTHLDAPWHFHSTMNNGKEKAKTIDEIPLDWCFKPGVKLDFRHLPDGYVVTALDIQNELKRINHKLKPLETVLVNTSAGKHFGQDDYLNKGCGMGREATLFLLEQGVKITGTDAWGWDAPFVFIKQKYASTKNPKIIWEGHKAGRESCYCHLEKLHNLEQLPATGFTVCCFPVKIKNASAGWTRAVAII
jgi:kynurenine formamidase